MLAAVLACAVAQTSAQTPEPVALKYGWYQGLEVRYRTKTVRQDPRIREPKVDFLVSRLTVDAMQGQTARLTVVTESRPPRTLRGRLDAQGKGDFDLTSILGYLPILPTKPLIPGEEWGFQGTSSRLDDVRMRFVGLKTEGDRPVAEVRVEGRVFRNGRRILIQIRGTSLLDQETGLPRRSDFVLESREEDRDGFVRESKTTLIARAL
jgi:hypothetical protein